MECGYDLDLDADVVGDHGNGGFQPVGGQPRVYAGLVHGIASRHKPKPNVPATPAARGPPQPQPPHLPWYTLEYQISF